MPTKKSPFIETPAGVMPVSGAAAEAKEEEKPALAPFKPFHRTPLADIAGLDLKKEGLSDADALFRRLRELKPHELAFAVAGLAVLCMAPMLDYLLSSPEEQAAGVGAGFNASGPAFSDAPAEIGVGLMAKGGVMEKDGMTITPFDGMDPLSLVRVREGDKDTSDGKVQGKSTEEKPAPEPEKPSGSWKDAIDAAKTGVRQAASHGPLPRPSAKLEGTLRGLAALQGGGSSGGASSGAALKTEIVSSKGLVGNPNTLAAMAPIKANADYRGAARSLTTGPAGGNPFGTGSRAPTSGGASSLLEAVSNGSGFSGAGAPSAGGKGLPDGAATANPSATSSAKDSFTKTNPPQQENLALLRQKEEMEQSIKLKWDKKRYDQIERKKMVEQIATQTAFQTAQQAFLKVLDKLLNPNGQGQGQGQGGGGGGGGGSGGGGSAVSGGIPAVSGADTGISQTLSVSSLTSGNTGLSSGAIAAIQASGATSVTFGAGTMTLNGGTHDGAQVSDSGTAGLSVTQGGSAGATTGSTIGTTGTVTPPASGASGT
ncbi:MAG TPA: hypothetical protein VNI01_09175 [Elusimicrobiota bacterium]|nr:hypothetical protein [Elusimicrobiota bacterium]